MRENRRCDSYGGCESHLSSSRTNGRSFMKSNPSDMDEKLRVFGDRVRRVWSERHPLTEKQLKSVRSTIEEQWQKEKTQTKKREISPSASSSERQQELKRDSQPQSQTKTKGHGHGH